ncbi:hypothetical protein I4U23_011386 [Adineta vaga]|nr:hypothetical protein I4U23_011386 [Adineta vaga]
MDTFNFANDVTNTKESISLFYKPITIIIDIIRFISRCWITVVLPICQLVIGIIFVHQCPIQRFIPIYLLVSGSASSIFLLVALLQKLVSYIAIKRNTVRSIVCCISTYCASTCCLTLIIIPYLQFSFIWFLAGNVWVYQVQSRVQYNHPNMTETYCQQNLYQFSYLSIILSWIFYFIWITIECCLQYPDLQYFCCPILVDKNLIDGSSSDSEISLEQQSSSSILLQTVSNSLPSTDVEQTIPHSPRSASEINSPPEVINVI